MAVGWITSCLLLLALSSRAEYDIDDSLLYKIEWPGQPLPSPGMGSGELGGGGGGGAEGGAPPMVPHLLAEGERGEEVVMTSVDNEKFTCSLPKVVAASAASSNPYTGPSVLGILEQLFTTQACAYRLESYWTYELCHGRYLRQYHEERSGKEIKVQEYSLGKFTKEMFDQLVVEEQKDVDSEITRRPPTKRIEGMSMPYHEVAMEGGDLCDLSGSPRRTRVLYVCYPAGRNEVYSLKEVSTCEYELVVLTAGLCSHPDYTPEESTEHAIACRPLGQGLKRKPERLTRLEIDGLKLRSEKLFEAHLSSGEGPGKAVKIEIRPVPVEGEQAEVEATSGQWKETVREPFKPLMDPEVVKEFLRGDYCLYGGSGWWKYEFCYGKKVDQYHEEAGGGKTVVRLGEFVEAEHLRWLEEHPTKRPKPKDTRKQVSIFYSGGDVCDVTGQKRKIEVKLKCKAADSPSTVSLYLLEPKTCEYVLGVESPLVCDLLPHAHPATGLFPSGIVDNLPNLPREVAPSPSDLEKLEQLRERIEEGGLMGEAFQQAGEVLAEASTTTRSSTKVQESVHESQGVRTVVRKTIVDGVVVSSTKETTRLDGQGKVEEGEEEDVEDVDEDEEPDDDLYDDDDEEETKEMRIEL